MRDVSNKVNTERSATARAVLRVSPSTIVLIREGKIPKGDPLPVAKVAAIQAAKNTSQIIPYCHPLPVDFVGVEFKVETDQILIEVTVKAIYKTGVEMEALTAASVAALTIYDMTKMLDESMEIGSITLLTKTGGKTDFKQSIAKSLSAAVIVLSDSVSAGKKEDTSGKLIVERLESQGLNPIAYLVIPDNPELLESTIKRFADQEKVSLIVTTGGTGLSPTDKTPEALKNVIEQPIPGISEAMRSYGQERTPYSMLSRSQAGLRGESLIVSLPGSRGGVKDSLDAIFPAVLHVFKMMRSGSHSSDQKELVKP